MNEIATYSAECAAGRKAAEDVIARVCADPDTLPRLVNSIREAVHDSDHGHGVGFLYAIAAAAIGCGIVDCEE